MPIEITVHTDPDHNLCRYHGQVSVADIAHLISRLEDSSLPPHNNVIHDMRSAESLELPGPDAAKFSFRRKATMANMENRQLRAAMVGASPEIEKALGVWRALFYGDEPRYVMRSFRDIDAARAWLES